MDNNILELLIYFIIYSFLGWVMESCVRSICEKKVINTGFLYGPFCPIYGFGAIIMLLFLNAFENHWFILFIASLIIFTLWEYLVGVLLEKIFKTKYWDYSDHKFNFQGRVCLVNSLCWGILGVLFIKFIHPFMVKILSYVDIVSIKISVSVLMAVFLTDMIISVIKVKNIKNSLEKVEILNKQIKEKLQELKNNDRFNKADLQVIVDELKKKRDRIFRKLYRRVYHLKKAFPAINTKEIAEILNKKIDIRKRDRKGE